ncbi:MAG: hypothetical protein ACRDNF_13185 [Streptosporangiaceae bacterium]
MRVILLGPQRRPTVDAVMGALGLDGPVVTITAGWQEREPDDAELGALVPGEAVNLGLYRRWLDVQDRDTEYAAGERRLQGVLAELQDLYLLRLDHALQAVHELTRRDGDPAVAVAAGEAIAAVRELDAAHLKRVNVVRREFLEASAPHDRPVIAEHRAFVAAALGEAAALIVAGGHVGVLTDVLHLFNVAPVLRPGAPVIAWSAGAMALADRIVLFHDRAPQGPGHPEIYGSGLSVLRDVVLLPHARARLLLDDTARMAVFARRFAPARCVLLEQGTKLDTEGTWLAGSRMLGEDGRVGAAEAA